MPRYSTYPYLTKSHTSGVAFWSWTFVRHSSSPTGQLPTGDVGRRGLRDRPHRGNGLRDNSSDVRCRRSPGHGEAFRSRIADTVPGAVRP